MKPNYPMITEQRHETWNMPTVAPPLHCKPLATGYGEDTTIVWICLELENVNLFAGVKEKRKKHAINL